mgnify:CR=1 FL=1
MKMISGARYHLEITWLDKFLFLGLFLGCFVCRYYAILYLCFVISSYFESFFERNFPISPAGILNDVCDTPAFIVFDGEVLAVEIFTSSLAKSMVLR